MKPLVILVLTFALVTATAKATLAHVDALGQPDPYWQQITAAYAARQVAAASAARGSQVPADGTAPSRAAADSPRFEILV